MTFSIVGFCVRTGMTGVAIATSSISVGSRCPWVRSGAGAVATQNITDPRIGIDVLDHMAAGLSAREALDRTMQELPNTGYRQVIAVDLGGNTALFEGANMLRTNAIAEGPHCVAAGNLLSTKVVPVVMAKAFEDGPDIHLANRLLSALEAGDAAGGEENPIKSSALLVAHDQRWPLVDLRVDWDDANPIETLRRLWGKYEPQMASYVRRALDPAGVPLQGVVDKSYV
jgi:uncharacterized Ntn-hydrolase superfamily protein